MRWLELSEIGEADVAVVGGKAQGLARMARAGLPVPDTVVLPEPLLAARMAHPHEPPTELLTAVCARLAAATLAVRSSSSVEDRSGMAGAGIFSSRIAVPIDSLWDAVVDVYQSASTPLASAYAERAAVVKPGSLAIILQPSLDGDPVVAYVLADGNVRLQRHGQVRNVAPTESHDDPVVVLARQAAAALHSPTGADLEFIVDDQAATIWLVQARPLPPSAPQRTAAPPSLLEPLRLTGRTWHWDVTHNPWPLSPAQAGLVTRVEAAALGTHHLATVAGYLYTSPRDQLAGSTFPDDEPPLRDAATQLFTDMEQTLSDDQPRLQLALDRYLATMRIWSDKLAPLVAHARKKLAEAVSPLLLAAQLAWRPQSIASLLASWAAAPENSPAPWPLQVAAPTWDVACPTFGEQPDLLAAARAAASPVSPTSPDRHPLAALVADLIELDDHWFARAQALVRHAIRATASARGLAADDGPWLPLELLLDESVPVTVLHARARASRAADARSRAWHMPLIVGAEADSPAELPGPPSAVFIGQPGGGHARGRVHRLTADAALGTAMLAPAGTVVLARAVTPAMAVLLPSAVALISATGGALDHGAAMAREFGLACVCACPAAWDQLVDGDLVIVDGEAGRITRLT